MPWQFFQPPSTTAASSEDARPCVSQLGHVRVWSLHIRTDACPTAASWKQALSRSLPPDFNRIGLAACTSCQQLQTVDLSQTDVIEILGSTFAHCSHSKPSLSRNFESLGKKPVPRCKKSASRHPCFTLRGVLLQVARNFEQFVKKEKARHGEVHMPGSMPLKNASN